DDQGNRAIDGPVLRKPLPVGAEHSGLSGWIANDRDVQLWFERLRIDSEGEQSGQGGNNPLLMRGEHAEHEKSTFVIDTAEDLALGGPDPSQEWFEKGRIQVVRCRAHYRSEVVSRTEQVAMSATQRLISATQRLIRATQGPARATQEYLARQDGGM